MSFIPGSGASLSDPRRATLRASLRGMLGLRYRLLHASERAQALGQLDDALELLLEAVAAPPWQLPRMVLGSSPLRRQRQAAK